MLFSIARDGLLAPVALSIAQDLAVLGPRLKRRKNKSGLYTKFQETSGWALAVFLPIHAPAVRLCVSLHFVYIAVVI